MKIAVIGPGALGCLLAAHLSDCHEVWLLDHNPERAALLNRQGITFEDGLDTRICRVRATAEPKIISSSDLTFLCVKAYRTETALKNSLPLINNTSMLIAMQNGIAHLPLLSKYIRNTVWALGVTTHGATLSGPGHIHHKGKGLTHIGLPPSQKAESANSRELLNQAAKILSESGIETGAVDNILDYVWNKLLVNAGINALTAIHNCPNGALLDSPEIAEDMAAAVLEGVAVAEKKGIKLAEDPVAMTKRVCQATAANISSMRQDVMAKRPTEINAINGALVREARRLGIAMPINEKLVRKILEIERKYLDFP